MARRRVSSSAHPRFLWLALSGALALALAAAAWVVLRPPAPAPPVAPGVSTGVTSEGLPYAGSPTAPVTLEEYADFQCPYCGEYARQTEPRLVQAYVIRGEVRIVWHPIAFLGEESVWAAEAARCAQDQGRFWPYAQLLYRHQGPENSGAFAIPRLETLARQAGLDLAAFRSCLKSGRYRSLVEAATAAARQRGVDATPTFFINGQKVTGALPFTEMARLLDASLRSRR